VCVARSTSAIRASGLSEKQTLNGLLCNDRMILPMSRVTWSRTKLGMAVGGVAVIVAVVVVLIVTSGGSSTSPTTTSLAASASVLNPSYARSVGFPKTVQAAKKSSVTDQKGCSSSVEAVYEDSGAKTGLISDVLNCKSAASAASALATARKHVAIDSSVTVPKELGASAFATASNAPEYLVVWQAGNRVAITAIDVNVAASSSTSSTVASAPLTQTQADTLGHAAVQQNSLYQ
jgi:hypothetical protein